jgi:hypothetical protein
MTPLKSTRTETVTSGRIGARDFEGLLERLAAAAAVEFDLHTSFRLDIHQSVLLACTLLRRSRSIVLNAPRMQDSPGLRDSLMRSLIGPLLWRSDRFDTTTTDSDALANHVPAHLDAERMLFCVSTELLNCGRRETFQADLATWLVRLRPQIDATLFARVTMLLYEACTNAEEHGSTRLTDAKAVDTRRVFRCLALRIHDEPGSARSPAADQYLSALRKSFGEPRRWLEAVVGDAGMGLTYASYLGGARRMGSTYSDVYVAEPLTERAQLDRVLNRGLSTKGEWGRVRSESSAIGMGMKLIRRNLARLRGFGSVRTGRFLATIRHAEADIEERTVEQLEYEVAEEPRPLFLGTAWHFLVPLDLQHTLPI